MKPIAVAAPLEAKRTPGSLPLPTSVERCRLEVWLLARGVDMRAASDAHVPRTQLNVQQRYDLAYLECMRAKGYEVSERAGARHAA